MQFNLTTILQFYLDTHIHPSNDYLNIAHHSSLDCYFSCELFSSELEIHLQMRALASRMQLFHHLLLLSHLVNSQHLF